MEEMGETGPVVLRERKESREKEERRVKKVILELQDLLDHRDLLGRVGDKD